MNYFSIFLDSVDSDQTDPIDEKSDLVLHCLLQLYAFLRISGLHAAIDV